MKAQSMHDSLKAIYLIQELQNGALVSTSSLASWLGFANASVTAMVKCFASSDPKLVDCESYDGTTLTKAVGRMGSDGIRHHRLIESCLSQVLGYSWDEVQEEADRLEHMISAAMEERMAQALGNSVSDPYGDPIPDREGNLHQPNVIPLTQLADEQPATIQHVIGQEPDLFRYLTAQGLILSRRIQIISKAPFNGPIHVRICGPSESSLSLGREVAEKILIQPTADPQ